MSPPADFDFFRDGAGGAARRSLEGHVLEEVRDAVLLGAFVAGPGFHPDSQRHRFQMRHVVRDHIDAIGKTGDLDTHTLYSAFLLQAV